MIADAMGWTLDRITDEIQPKIATAHVESSFITVEPGLVCGIVQDGVGYRKGEPVIKLHMEAYLGAPESYDATRIIGNPPLSMKIAGGVHGDVATASIAGELDSESARGAARAPHDARHGAAVVLRGIDSKPRHREPEALRREKT